MVPRLLTADEKNLAPATRLMTPEFRRMVALVWPHKRYLVIGLLGSIIYGLLHSVSIIGVLPVLKVMLTEEGLHGWVEQSITHQRLHCDLYWERGALRARSAERPSTQGARGLEERDRVEQFRLVMPGDPKTATADQPIEEAARLHERVTAEPNAVAIELQIEPADGAIDERQTVTLPMEHTSFKWRVIRGMARIVPRATTPDQRVRTLVWVLGGIVLVAILSSVARFFAEYYLSIGVFRGVMDLRRTLYRKVLRLPMQFFATDVSDIVSRFVTDSQEIQRGLQALYSKLLCEPVKAIFLLAAALWLDARLTLALLLVAPVAMLMFWVVGRKIRKANKRLLQAYGMMIGALSSTLHAIGVVKSYGAERIERKRLWQIDRKMFTHLLRIARLEAILKPLLEVLAVVCIAGISIWLGAQVILHNVQLEDFVTLVLLLGMLVDPLRKLSDVYPRVMRSGAAAARIYDVIDAPEEIELQQGAVELAPLADSIVFDNVTFTYPGAVEPALKGVSLRIARGESVAFVGANGSGKTTLTRLISRFYDPQAGTVSIDGVDLRRATLRSLRRQISIVTQDPVVFAMTLTENIAYGARHPDEQRVLDAARQAHADEFIRARPEGYAEVAGERGGTLSGGQRQRLCIARAIYRDAPIFIFDEATSQIDSESERSIQDAVRELAANRTTILIAHRLSTIRFAQRIIVMAGGQVIDSGSHDELLSRCDVYITLCRTQLIE